MDIRHIENIIQALMKGAAPHHVLIALHNVVNRNQTLFPLANEADFEAMSASLDEAADIMEDME